MSEMRFVGLLALGALLSSAGSSGSSTSVADDFYDIGDLFAVVDALNDL